MGYWGLGILDGDTPLDLLSKYGEEFGFYKYVQGKGKKPGKYVPSDENPSEWGTPTRTPKPEDVDPEYEEYDPLIQETIFATLGIISGQGVPDWVIKELTTAARIKAHTEPWDDPKAKKKILQDFVKLAKKYALDPGQRWKKEPRFEPYTEFGPGNRPYPFVGEKD